MVADNHKLYAFPHSRYSGRARSETGKPDEAARRTCRTLGRAHESP